jgi:hypothetical protein
MRAPRPQSHLVNPLPPPRPIWSTSTAQIRAPPLHLARTNPPTVPRIGPTPQRARAAPRRPRTGGNNPHRPRGAPTQHQDTACRARARPAGGGPPPARPAPRAPPQQHPPRLPSSSLMPILPGGPIFCQVRPCPASFTPNGQCRAKDPGRGCRQHCQRRAPPPPPGPAPPAPRTPPPRGLGGRFNPARAACAAVPLGSQPGRPIARCGPCLWPTRQSEASPAPASKTLLSPPSPPLFTSTAAQAAPAPRPPQPPLPTARAPPGPRAQAYTPPPAGARGGDPWPPPSPCAGRPARRPLFAACPRPWPAPRPLAPPGRARYVRNTAATPARAPRLPGRPWRRASEKVPAARRCVPGAKPQPRVGCGAPGAPSAAKCAARPTEPYPAVWAPDPAPQRQLAPTLAPAASPPCRLPCCFHTLTPRARAAAAFAPSSGAQAGPWAPGAPLPVASPRARPPTTPRQAGPIEAGSGRARTSPPRIPHHLDQPIS